LLQLCKLGHDGDVIFNYLFNDQCLHVSLMAESLTFKCLTLTLKLKSLLTTLNLRSRWSVLSQQWACAAETEVVRRCDDVIESCVSQMNVLYRRINDVINLRVDAVKEVGRCW